MKNFKRSISRKIKRFLELFDRNYSKEYCFILLKIPSHKSSNCRLREKKGETIRYNKDFHFIRQKVNGVEKLREKLVIIFED